MVRLCYHQRRSIYKMMEWRIITLIATGAITLMLFYTITYPIHHFPHPPTSTPIQPFSTPDVSAFQFNSSPVADVYLEKSIIPSEATPFPITNDTVNEMGAKPKVIFFPSSSNCMLRCFSWSFLSFVFCVQVLQTPFYTSIANDSHVSFPIEDLPSVNSYTKMVESTDTSVVSFPELQV